MAAVAPLGNSDHSSLSAAILFLFGLVSESVGKTDILSAHFDGKQSRDPIDLPSTCHPSPSLTIFSFKSSFLAIRLLLDLDFYGGTDPLGIFLLFFNGTADIQALVSCYFGVSYVRVAFQFAVEWLMSPQFQRVHLPDQWPFITDQSP